MFVSVGIRSEAKRDLQRILDLAPEADRSRIRYLASLLYRWVKFDPHLIGSQPTARPIRRVIHGPLMLFYSVASADDRYAEVIGFSFISDWTT